MNESSTPKKIKHYMRFLFAPAIVFSIIYMAVLALWYHEQKDSERELSIIFGERINGMAGLLEQRMIAYEQVLRGTGGLFTASTNVDRGEYARYIQSLNIENNYPGIQSIGYNPIITKAEVKNFIEKIRQEGYPDFSIFPEVTREISTPIYYIEPFSERNLHAFGFDPFSEPTRRAAMELARDSGRAALTTKLELIQETARNKQSGFIMFLPIYKPGMPVSNVTERRAAIQGWVYVAFRSRDFVLSVLGEQGSDFDIEIFDGETLDEQSLLYDNDTILHAAQTEGAENKMRRMLSVEGRPWTLFISMLPNFKDKYSTSNPSALLYGGIGFGLFCSLILWFWLRHKDREAVSANMLSIRYKNMIQQAHDAIFLLDETKSIIEANESAKELFGYSLEEIFRKPFSSLLLPGAPEGGTPLSVRKTKIGIIYETSCVKKNGAVFIASVSSRSFALDNTVTEVLIINDISIQKEAERELREREEKFRILTESIEDVVWELDQDSIFTYISPADERLRGFRADEVIGASIYSFIDDETRKLFGNITSETFQRVELGEQLKPIQLEVRLKRKDGSYVWTDVRSTPFLDQEGKLAGSRGITRDISERKRIEEQLKESEERYKLLLDVSPMAIFETDKEGVFVYVNQHMLEMAEMQPEDIIGTFWWNLISSLDRQSVIHQWNSLSGSNNSVQVEYRVATVSGAVRWAFGRIVPLINSAGTVTGYLGVSFDITERKREEEFLKMRHDLDRSLGTTSELQIALQLILNSVMKLPGIDSAGIYLFDAQTGGSSLAVHSGLSEEFIRQVEYFPADSSHTKMLEKGAPVYTSSERERLENDDLMRAEGLRMLASIPIFSQGKLIASLNIGSHVIAELPAFVKAAIESIAAQIGAVLSRIRSNATVTEARKNFESLFASIEDYLFVLDTKGNIVLTNPIVQKRLGYSEQELLRMNVLEVHPAARREEARRIVFEMLKGGVSICSIPLLTKTGESIPVETRAVRGTWNNEDAIFGISRNITERERIAKALKQSEEQLNLAIEGSGLGMWDWDIPSGKIQVNEQWANILGCTLFELFPVTIETWERLLYPDDLIYSNTILKKHFSGEMLIYECELRMKHKNGSWVWILDRGKVSEWDANGKPIRMIGTHLDITRRKQIEITLRENEEKYKVLFENKLTAISIFDTETFRYIDVNEAFEKMYGYTHAELVNSKTVLDLSAEPEESRKALEQGLLEGRIFIKERKHRKKDGTVFPAEIVGESYMLQGRKVFFTILVDISERLEAHKQLEQIAEELRSSNVTKDKFFSIIAHDLRAPFHGFLGITSIILKEIETLPRSEIAALNKTLYESLRKQFDLLENLLRWAKVSSNSMRFLPEDINAYDEVNHAVDFIRPMAEKKYITVETQVDRLTRFYGDLEMIRLVLRNLLTNAVKYTPPTGVVTVTVTEAKEHVLVSVSDTGIGMDTADMDKLFRIDKSFSKPGTDKEYGSGLGLILCKEILSKHSGNIHVQSELGRGSTFTFSLPKQKDFIED